MVSQGRMLAPTPYVFQLVTPHRSTLFCGEDETTALAWMHAMRSVSTPPPLSASGLRVKPRSRFVLPVRVQGSEEVRPTHPHRPTALLRPTHPHRPACPQCTQPSRAGRRHGALA